MKLKISILTLFVAHISFAQMKPEDTEVWEPQPKLVSLLGINAIPSDAFVIFDGKNLDNFSDLKGGNAAWEVKDGAFTVVPGKGDIKTKKSFGSFQLHIEWRSPAKVENDGQNRGNSGIFLQERYEVQVLDNYMNKTYANGQAGSIYKQAIPLANACKKPGEWQSYDIIFSAPKFYLDSTLAKPAFVTVMHNGVLVQNNTEIKGPSVWQGFPVYKAHGKAPIKLQDHGCLVSYRNIWVRELE